MPITTISIREAKARLSELADRASAGETIIVTRHGKPVMQLSEPERPRQAVDLQQLRALTEPQQKQPAGVQEFIRALRDGDRY